MYGSLGWPLWGRRIIVCIPSRLLKGLRIMFSYVFIVLMAT